MARRLNTVLAVFFFYWTSVDNSKLAFGRRLSELLGRSLFLLFSFRLASNPKTLEKKTNANRRPSTWTARDGIERFEVVHIRS